MTDEARLRELDTLQRLLSDAIATAEAQHRETIFLRPGDARDLYRATRSLLDEKAALREALERLYTALVNADVKVSKGAHEIIEAERQARAALEGPR